MEIVNTSSEEEERYDDHENEIFMLVMNQKASYDYEQFWMGKKKKDMMINKIKTDDDYEKWMDRGILNYMRDNHEDIFMDFENYRPETVIALARDRFIESNEFVNQFLSDNMIYSLEALLLWGIRNDYPLAILMVEKWFNEFNVKIDPVVV